MTIENTVLYPMAWAVLLAVLGSVGGSLEEARAQSSDTPQLPSASPEWTLVLDGTPGEWPDGVSTASLDSIQVVSRRVLDQFRREGYYYARLDSAVVDTTRRPPEVQLYAHQGPRVEVGALDIIGAEAIPVRELRRLIDTQAGAPLVPERLEADIQAVLDRYEEVGHPLAQVHVERTAIDSTDSARLRLTLRVEEGPALWLKQIETSDTTRTDPALLAHLAGLTIGDPLTDYDPAVLRERLTQSELFRSVEAPELSIGPEGGATLHIPVEEAPPGTFDLVLGYLPASSPDGSGQFIGSGHLLLEHLFGKGRRVDLTLDRRPDRASVFDLSLSDPYVLGLPLRVEGQFRGEQRDSTYGERTYGLEVGYRFAGGMELVGSVRREVVRPGPAGTRIQDTRQQIARAHSFFYGLGVRYQNLNRPVNPRRGVQLDVQLEQGQKDRRFRRVTAGGDTTRVAQSLRQERLNATIRTFAPLFERHVLVVGGDGAVLRSDEYDRSDLFQFGGTQSLRGYDEDRFLGTVTGRGFLEYRLQIDRRSFAYAFGDMGFVHRPSLGTMLAHQSWRPGYGLGIQLSTGIGLLTTTYALNPEVETFTNGRIHFGLSVEL